MSDVPTPTMKPLEHSKEAQLAALQKEIDKLIDQREKLKGAPHG